MTQPARDVPLEHATVGCRLTRSENLLYHSERQASRYGPSEWTAESAQRMLRACTQFSADAAESLDSAVQRELRRRRAELQTEERRVAHLTSRAEGAAPGADLAVEVASAELVASAVAVATAAQLVTAEDSSRRTAAHSLPNVPMEDQSW